MSSHGSSYHTWMQMPNFSARTPQRRVDGLGSHRWKHSSSSFIKSFWCVERRSIFRDAYCQVLQNFRIPVDSQKSRIWVYQRGWRKHSIQTISSRDSQRAWDCNHKELSNSWCSPTFVIGNKHVSICALACRPNTLSFSKPDIENTHHLILSILYQNDGKQTEWFVKVPYPKHAKSRRTGATQ